MLTTRLLASLALLIWTAVSWSGVRSDEQGQVVDLVHAAWVFNAEPIETPVLVGPQADRAVRLALEHLGDRWSTTFSTDVPASWRIGLEWEPGPDGLLIEILLDGEPLTPLRDSWRPTARRLSADLGPRWLGRGEHLIEFVAREARQDGALDLRRLLIELP
jgi:hypothetical protein